MTDGRGRSLVSWLRVSREELGFYRRRCLSSGRSCRGSCKNGTRSGLHRCPLRVQSSRPQFNLQSKKKKRAKAPLCSAGCRISAEGWWAEPPNGGRLPDPASPFVSARCTRWCRARATATSTCGWPSRGVCGRSATWT